MHFQGVMGAVNNASYYSVLNVSETWGSAPLNCLYFNSRTFGFFFFSKKEKAGLNSSQNTNYNFIMFKVIFPRSWLQGIG